MDQRSATVTAPTPTPTRLTAPFWEGCKVGKLRLQQCPDCGKLRFYPAESCPFCGTIGGEWIDTSGRGTIYSWIVVHKNPDSFWRTRVPYISGIVELDDQQRLYMPGLLTDVSPDAVKAGMAVAAWFEEVAPGERVPRWRPVDVA